MPQLSRHARLLVAPILACLVLLVVGACSEPSDASSADAPGLSAAEAEAVSDRGSAPAVGSDAFPPIPELAADGTLPRSYAGLTLGDPPPAGAEKSENPPAFYPGATQHLLRVSESPRIIVAAIVHGGTIFRIEWRTHNPSFSREEVVAAFEEVLGTVEESEWLPDHVTNWDDGLSEGDTFVTVFQRPGSEWLKVSLGDSGRDLQLLKVGN